MPPFGESEKETPLKRIFSLLLCVCLCLSLLLPTALATEQTAEPITEQEAELFPRGNAYITFSDARDHWAEPNIRVCVEAGLMEGVGGGRFAPEATLSNAEVATIAARLQSAFTRQPIPEGITSPWYQRYFDYLSSFGIAAGAPSGNATRQSFFSLLAQVVPYQQLTPINTITALPDSSDPEVLRFYNAGILTGIDSYGTFDGASPLTRAQCATMVARIAEPALRRHFTPAGQVPAGALAAETIIFTVNTAPVTYGEYEDVLLTLARQMQEMYLKMGLEFTWEGSYGEDWPTYFSTATLHSLTASHVAELKAAELGCTEDLLAAALFPAPTEEELLHAAQTHALDLSNPEEHEQAVEIILDEKLNAQLSIWVDEARLVFLPEYEALDPVAICQDLLQHAPVNPSILTTNS